MQVFYTSPWIPPEWIKAHGLEPRGIWSVKNLWLDSVPLSAGLCSFAEAVVRFSEAQTEGAVVFTTTCDQLRRGFDAARAAGRSRVFLFNIPAAWQTPVARQIYRAEVERLGRFLVELGGRAPSPRVLAGEMAKYGRGRDCLLAAAPHCASRQFAEAVARFHWEGTVELPEPPAAAPAGGVPLAVVGGPLPAPQSNLLEVIEALGGRMVLNATETGERSLWPSYAADGPVDEPLDVLVRGGLANIVDVFQRPNTPLYFWLEERLRARHARGIVLWHFTGCDLWRAEAQTLREAFGLPVLLLEADEAQGCAPRDVGRIEAFVETLQ
jgi:benzoyl-CoA reductase/2-hydroxyglutaryl-CoA dehydratase subunit BcrC/BadD/HgdB